MSLSLGKLTLYLFLFTSLITIKSMAKGICAEGSYWNGVECIGDGDLAFPDTRGDENGTVSDASIRVPNPADGDAALVEAQLQNRGAAEADECSKARVAAVKECGDLSMSQRLSAMTAYQFSSFNLGNANVASATQSIIAASTIKDSIQLEKVCGGVMNLCKNKCDSAMQALNGISSQKENYKKASENMAYCQGQESGVGSGAMAGLMQGLSSLANSAMNYAATRGGQPSGAPTTDPFPTTTASTLPDGTLSMPTLTTDDVDPYTMKNASANPTKYDASGGGGGGGPSGGAYPGGAPLAQQGGERGSGIKTDIDKGFTTGGGGFTTSGVAVGGGGGNGRGGSGSGYDRGLDLSKYLPGGECDPANPAKTCAARGIASVEKMMSANGITGANDLSNFEKVSRAMAQHRPRLTP